MITDESGKISEDARSQTELNAENSLPEGLLDESKNFCEELESSMAAESLQKFNEKKASFDMGSRRNSKEH